jgi:hypothetical protein
MRSLTSRRKALRAVPQAVGLVSTPLKALYDSLSDEQKTRINALADPT